MTINGRKLAKEMIADLKKQFKKYEKVLLAAIMIKGNSASLSFLRQKNRVAQFLGIELRIYKLSSNISNKKLIKELEKLSKSKIITGIIIQLPLPEKFNLDRILKSLPVKKDVDALSPHSQNLAPTVEVVKFIFEKYKIQLTDKKIVVNGFGRLTGKPIYNWLKTQRSPQDIFVIEENIPQKERVNLIKTADILISGVGKANLIPSAWVKERTVIIDFGYSFKRGKIYGDVAKEAAEKAELFTPTPGGTGPLLVAMIYQNLLNLIKGRS